MPTDPTVIAPEVPTEPVLPLPFEQLTADEVHELRRLLDQSRDERSRLRKLPELPITETDQDRFAECLMSGQPYREEFSRYKGKFLVTLRSRFKWEEDMIIEQIFQDFSDKTIKSDGQYANRLNLYNLLFQMEQLDGVEMTKIRQGDNLREKLSQSLLETIVEPKLFILTSLLFQFDAKVSKLCQTALESPDFSKPDVAS